jgi:hypothetical protein
MIDRLVRFAQVRGALFSNFQKARRQIFISPLLHAHPFQPLPHRLIHRRSHALTGQSRQPFYQPMSSSFLIFRLTLLPFYI